MKASKRLIWADALRGLLIILVVIGHSLQFDDFENRMSWNIINSFHVAAFFFISGFVSYKSEYLLSSIKDKFIQLMLPFLSWTLLKVFFYGGGTTAFLNYILHPDCAFWFVWCLFFINLIFIIIRNIPLRGKININICVDISDLLLLFTVILLAVIMVITEYRLFGFQFLALYFGFYVSGYLVRKWNVNFKINWIFLLGGAWLILAFFWRKHEVPLPLQGLTFIPASLLTYSYRYLTAFIGSLFFTFFAMKFMDKDNIVLKFLSYLGKISLGIYIIHLFISSFTINYYRGLLQSDMSISFVLLNSITQIIISIILTKIILRIPIVRFFLLGKK